MSLNRRTFLGSLTVIAAPNVAAAQGFDAASLGLRPDAPDDQTRQFQRAMEAAAGARRPLILPAGTYRIGEVRLPQHAQIQGVRGATRLLFQSGTACLSAAWSDHVSLIGLTIEGGGRPLPERRGLVSLGPGQRVRIEDCEFTGASRNAITMEGTEGIVRGNTISGANQGIFALDSRGLSIAHNTIRACANNGIIVWRTMAGDDGTIIEGNRIEDISSRAGGSGQNGNAINIFRAANVLVKSNRVRNCAFSAVRGNASSGLSIQANIASGMGETAYYVEFGFEGAIISGNTVDGAALGVVTTNFNEGGRLATIQGNMIRNLMGRRPPGTDPGDIAGVGIAAEADASISGNVIENAPTAGIWLGWGQYMRDIAATGNLIRNAPIGVAVSVAPGAGTALVADNLVQGASRGAVVGMEWKRPVTADLTREGASRFVQLTVSGNKVR